MVGRTLLVILGLVFVVAACAQGSEFEPMTSTGGDAGGGGKGDVSSSSSANASSTSGAATGGAGGMTANGGMGGANSTSSSSSVASSSSSTSSGSDPCAGVTCTAPPIATCLDGMTRQTYSPTGTCMGGTCMYDVTNTPCAAGETCMNGACQQSTCVMPNEACSDGNQSRAGCANARVIGRILASSIPGFSVTANTCSASNSSEGPNSSACWDYGRDHAYRMFMRSGETANISIGHGSKCASATSWDAVFKIYAGTGCLDKSCTTKSECTGFSTGTLTRTFTAPADGWYVFVIDGRTATNVYDDSGTYTLTVKLTCSVSGCGC